MADITITAANVVKGSNAKTKYGVGGATIAQGKVLYRDATTGKMLLADAGALATLPLNADYGIALQGVSDNQPIEFLTEGDITIGATLVVGETYVVSETAGGIAPIGDLLTGDFTCLVGIAKTTAILSVKFHTVGVAKA